MERLRQEEAEQLFYEERQLEREREEQVAQWQKEGMFDAYQNLSPQDTANEHYMKGYNAIK